MQVTFKAAHQSPGEIKTQPGRLGILLKRVEEALRVGNPTASIAKANRDAQALAAGPHD
jgi:hypothetical protein